ncbi:O-antigen ligase family protein [Candidatus Uhrbacteria bacterium]|nr:O-antigen ligase family protein [Candidatus Uhrbacteria bacterium]
MPLIIHIGILSIPLIVVTALPYSYVFPKGIAFLLLVEILIISALISACKDRESKRESMPLQDGTNHNNSTLLKSKSRMPVAIPVALALFIFISLLTTATSMDAFRSFFSDQPRMTGMFFLLHAGVWFFLLTAIFKKNVLAYHMLTIASVGIAALVALYALAQMFAAFPTFAISHNGRVASTLGNPLYLGHYLMLNIWIAALAAAHEYRASVRRILYAYIPLALCVILLTGNRSTIAIAGVGILVFGALSLRKKIVPKIFLVFTAVVIIAAALIMFEKPDSHLFQPAKRVFTELFNDPQRLVLWNIGIRSWLQKPILGWGNGNYEYAHYANVRVPEEYRLLSSGIPGNAHNAFIEILVSSGIVGLIAILILMGSIVFALISVWRTGDLKMKLSSLYLAAFFISAALQDLVIFDTPSTLITVILALAILAYFVGKKGSGAFFFPQKRLLTPFSMPLNPYMVSVGIMGIAAICLYLVIFPAYGGYLSIKAWRLFEYDMPASLTAHERALVYSAYLAPDARAVLAGNVISAYNSGGKKDALMSHAVPLAVKQSELSFLEHPLSVPRIIQYATLLRIAVTEKTGGNYARSLLALMRYAHETYPRYPDIRYEELQSMLALNAIPAFHAGTAEMLILAPDNARTYWFAALSSLLHGKGAETVDNLKQAEARGYDIVEQTDVWKFIADATDEKNIPFLRDAIGSALQKKPNDPNLLDAISILKKKQSL